ALGRRQPRAFFSLGGVPMRAQPRLLCVVAVAAPLFGAIATAPAQTESPSVIFTTRALFSPGPGAGGFLYVSGGGARYAAAANAVPALQGRMWRAWLSAYQADIAGGQTLAASRRLA